MALMRGEPLVTKLAYLAKYVVLPGSMEYHKNRVDHPVWFITTLGLQQSIINLITVCKYKKVDPEEETVKLLLKCNLLENQIENSEIRGKLSQNLVRNSELCEVRARSYAASELPEANDQRILKGGCL
ncbi:hypothetical protein QQP08_023313 [Theobroma cacao]|nr:hypothetical protein QQP08_023313 [Theobroma cacao]